jgi:hypothetical protein
LCSASRGAPTPRRSESTFLFSFFESSLTWFVYTLRYVKEVARLLKFKRKQLFEACAFLENGVHLPFREMNWWLRGKSTREAVGNIMLTWAIQTDPRLSQLELGVPRGVLPVQAPQTLPGPEQRQQPARQCKLPSGPTLEKLAEASEEKIQKFDNSKQVTELSIRFTSMKLV